MPEGYVHLHELRCGDFYHMPEGDRLWEVTHLGKMVVEVQAEAKPEHVRFTLPDGTVREFQAQGGDTRLVAPGAQVIPLERVHA